VRQLKQQLVGGREAALGVLPEVQRWVRLAEICDWRLVISDW
jgi:hypothetical protein